eukprot:COSAG01_NODE_23854_length_799_cov_1.642857_1_plen_231_part_10
MCAHGAGRHPRAPSRSGGGAARGCLASRRRCDNHHSSSSNAYIHPTFNIVTEPCTAVRTHSAHDHEACPAAMRLKQAVVAYTACSGGAAAWWLDCTRPGLFGGFLGARRLQRGGHTADTVRDAKHAQSSGRQWRWRAISATERWRSHMGWGDEGGQHRLDLCRVLAALSHHRHVHLHAVVPPRRPRSHRASGGRTPGIRSPSPSLSPSLSLSLSLSLCVCVCVCVRVSLSL